MKILYVATISLTINSFFKNHIKMLVEEGHRVDIACNYSDLELVDLYDDLNCHKYQIDFSRSPLSKDNIKAYKQLKSVIKNGKYDIVHCHTPNASVITRLVCRKFRKNGLKVFYTAHGFHFYKGAPLLNWLFFYPVEKFCSHFTDKLITINNEDYMLAQKKLCAVENYYIPGVGIDSEKFRNVTVDVKQKRSEIGVPQNAFLLLSVGELNKNKNHQVIIKAIAQLKNENIHYAVAGIGEQKDDLVKLAHEKNISDQIHFLGYRHDVAQLYKSADCFVFPSFREGLSVSLMEAMACGLPCIVSKIRGNVDLICSNDSMCIDPNDDEGFASAVKTLVDNDDLRNTLIEQNKLRVEMFSTENVLRELIAVYK